MREWNRPAACGGSFQDNGDWAKLVGQAFQPDAGFAFTQSVRLESLTYQFEPYGTEHPQLDA
jgi:hypothetical protein